MTQAPGVNIFTPENGQKRPSLKNDLDLLPRHVALEFGQ
jgi:hypothetical protein